MPIEEFTPDKWVFNEMPGENDQPFTGVLGPRHTLSTDTAIPYAFFFFACLFLFILACCAQYCKPMPKLTLSELNQTRRVGHGYPHVLLSWKLGFGLQQFCVGIFFLTFSFQKICTKWIHKESDSDFRTSKTLATGEKIFQSLWSTSDAEHKENKAWCVREIWDYFRNACKA